MLIQIGLDLDGVIFDFGSHYLNYLDFKDKTPPKEWNDKRFNEGFKYIADDPHFWSTIPLLVKPSEILFDINCFCTARTISNDVSTQTLRNNGYTQPCFTVGYDGSKVETLKNRNINVFIDDAIHNFEELNDNGINCLLMTRSHNEHYKTSMRLDCIKNLTDWDILKKIINK